MPTAEQGDNSRQFIPIIVESAARPASCLSSSAFNSVAICQRNSLAVTLPESDANTKVQRLKRNLRAFALSTGPIAATADAGNKRGPVTIRLTDGTTIKADEVWETREGIWYRRRGLVTLLKRDQVKALENFKPTPSPTPSPVPSP